MHDGNIFSRFKVGVKVTGNENCQIWPHARSSSDRINGSEWKFPYYGSLGHSPGPNEAGFFDFVSGARSHDTKLRPFGEINSLVSSSRTA